MYSVPPNSMQPAAGFRVAAAHGVDYLADGDVIGLQPVRIDVHLVLTAETADRRNFRHARHGLQVIAQIPVLQRSQLGQTVLPESR